MRISHSSISQVTSRHAMFKIGCYVLATLSSDVGSRNDVTPFTLTRQRTNRTHDQLRTLDSDVLRMHTNPRINASEVVSPTMSDAPVRVFWATVTRAYDRRSLDIMLNLAEVGSKDLQFLAARLPIVVHMYAAPSADHSPLFTPTLVHT
jgi:hypothetical protein